MLTSDTPMKPCSFARRTSCLIAASLMPRRSPLNEGIVNPWFEPPAAQDGRLVARPRGADDQCRAGHRRRGRWRRGDRDPEAGELAGAPLPAFRARTVDPRRGQLTDRRDGVQVLPRLEAGTENADRERPGARQQVGRERRRGGRPVSGDRVPVDQRDEFRGLLVEERDQVGHPPGAQGGGDDLGSHQRAVARHAGQDP
jgi:hypothetical protein